MPDLSPAQSELQDLLGAVRDGDLDARDRLVALLYEDLRKAAAQLMERERPDHTLQPSALVHEAMIKLLSADAFRKLNDREHFYRAAVAAMRQVLADHHRHRMTRKGPGALRRHRLDDVLDRLNREHRVEIEALNEALDALAVNEPRACLVTTFQSFLGLSLPEVAEALEISLATAERDWAFARAWLRERLKPDRDSR